MIPISWEFFSCDSLKTGTEPFLFPSDLYLHQYFQLLLSLTFNLVQSVSAVILIPSISTEVLGTHRPEKGLI